MEQRCKKCGGSKTKKSGKYMRCKPCTDARIGTWREKVGGALQVKNLAYKAENRDRANRVEKERREKIRSAVLDHYGKSCECCGESERAFLCIDHVAGGGNEHRRSVGSGTALQKWLLDSNFPPGFRTLCHNCNHCAWAHGQCIHRGPPTKTGSPRYEYMKELRREVRMRTLLHYGDGKVECRCCGEDRFEFLCLDHLNGGGKKHRQEVGRGTVFYRWIVKAGFPPGFQVLCQNCNFGKGSGETCPCRLSGRSKRVCRPGMAGSCNAGPRP